MPNLSGTQLAAGHPHDQFNYSMMSKARILACNSGHVAPLLLALDANPDYNVCMGLTQDFVEVAVHRSSVKESTEIRYS